MPEKSPSEGHSSGRLAVGLISGTSMDGVDAALVRLAGSPDHPRVRLLAALTVPYPPRLRRRLLEVAGGGSTSAGEISRLNFLLGEVFAAAALQVCRRARVAPARLAVIGSHGQTVFHHGKPSVPRGQRPGATLQIAEPAVIAERTGVRVVADFRTADIAAGGEGAPLVAVVDYLLLKDRQKGTVVLNLGGIANVTVIPAGASPQGVLGFDTGPGNMVIDALVRHASEGRESYDTEGRLAAKGQVLEPLLAELVRFPFFHRRPPKSAGREQFGERFVNRYFLSRRGTRFKDLLCTATELTARTIADALRNFVLSRAAIHRLIMSGGGAHNRLLVRRLKELLPELEIQLSDAYGLPMDAKEAIAFALLADRTLRGLPGNLPSVTGARRRVVLGKIARP